MSDSEIVILAAMGSLAAVNTVTSAVADHLFSSTGFAPLAASGVTVTHGYYIDMGAKKRPSGQIRLGNQADGPVEITLLGEDALPAELLRAMAGVFLCDPVVAILSGVQFTVKPWRAG